MKNILGIRGENLVKEHIQKLGWQVLVMNYHARFGEIDIIARDRDEIVFIEVKTRSSTAYGEPEESVGYSKFHKMIKTAQFYLLSKHLEQSPYRFDLFTVKKNRDGMYIEHFKNIFL